VVVVECECPCRDYLVGGSSKVFAMLPNARTLYKSEVKGESARVTQAIVVQIDLERNFHVTAEMTSQRKRLLVGT
jgi:hypothetical protein